MIAISAIVMSDSLGNTTDYREMHIVNDCSGE